MTLNEVADLIDAPDAESLCWGNYKNRRGVRGYYQQTKCGNHWCKISVSNVDRHSDRLTVGELDDIDINALDRTTKIPRLSISYALRWASERDDVAVERYVNAADVEGIWSEFSYGNNWYMVSVSHVNVPAYASRDDLERIADEFLRQQRRQPGRNRDRSGR